MKYTIIGKVDNKLGKHPDNHEMPNDFMFLFLKYFFCWEPGSGLLRDTETLQQQTLVKDVILFALMKANWIVLTLFVGNPTYVDVQTYNAPVFACYNRSSCIFLFQCNSDTTAVL